MARETITSGRLLVSEDKRVEQILKSVFKLRREELLKRLARLKLREESDWGYRRVRREEVRVKAHSRKAHWAMVPVRGTK